MNPRVCDDNENRQSAVRRSFGCPPGGIEFVILTEFPSDVFYPRRMRLLLVDDEVRMAAVLKRGLEEDGYRVDVVSTGADALQKAAEFAYDAVLLDVLLPGMSGVEVCRRLRAQWVHAPIIMVSASDSLIDRINGLEAGANDYLLKPVSFAKLTAAVQASARHCRDRSAS